MPLLLSMLPPMLSVLLVATICLALAVILTAWFPERPVKPVKTLDAKAFAATVLHQAIVDAVRVEMSAARTDLTTALQAHIATVRAEIDARFGTFVPSEFGPRVADQLRKLLAGEEFRARLVMVMREEWGGTRPASGEPVSPKVAICHTPGCGVKVVSLSDGPAHCFQHEPGPKYATPYGLSPAAQSELKNALSGVAAPVDVPPVRVINPKDQLDMREREDAIAQLSERAKAGNEKLRAHAKTAAARKRGR